MHIPDWWGRTFKRHSECHDTFPYMYIYSDSAHTHICLAECKTVNCRMHFHHHALDPIDSNKSMKINHRPALNIINCQAAFKSNKFVSTYLLCAFTHTPALRTCSKYFLFFVASIIGKYWFWIFMCFSLRLNRSIDRLNNRRQDKNLPILRIDAI